MWLATFFYVIYTLVSPLSFIGGSTYLRKIAVYEDVPSSLAMGVTILHATAIVVPVAAGFILNYTGYQIPFYIACGFALINLVVTLRLDPVKQRSAARIAVDNAAAAQRAAGASEPRLSVGRGRPSRGHPRPTTGQRRSCSRCESALAEAAGE